MIVRGNEEDKCIKLVLYHANSINKHYTVSVGKGEAYHNGYSCTA